MAKKLKRKLAGVILWSLLLLPAAPASAAPAETPATPQLPDLGQLLPSAPKPPPGPQIADQPPAAAAPRPAATRVPPGRSQKPEAAQVPPRRRQAAAPPPQTRGGRRAGSPRVDIFTMAANDVSMLRGCWEVEFEAFAICRSFTLTLCFDEHGRGEMTIIPPDGSEKLQGPAVPIYDGGLVIYAGLYSDVSSVPSLSIKCALSREDEEAGACFAVFTDDAVYCGQQRVSLKPR